ncbi:NUDIX hydrolase N-terminal domain-containing protein [Dietzia timorensis]|uniref:NUDIX hydrolase N-terminal domain-containing protein n=1 Tax=Dietzia timorensis TaxID=499555 RepID=UPI0018D30B25
MVQQKESTDLRRLSIELTAIAESGLAYCDDQFDIERFHRIARLAADLTDTIATNPPTFVRQTHRLGSRLYDTEN